MRRFWSELLLCEEKIFLTIRKRKEVVRTLGKMSVPIGRCS